VKIVSVKPLELRDIHVIRYGRFCDHRGYFTESSRKSDFQSSLTPFLRGVEFVQTNESFSRAGTVRGLHFQWNPFVGKLIRTLQGHMVDLVLDIRKGSPTFGKIIAYDMPAANHLDYNEWIWVPPGFAHGNLFLEATLIEYFCTGEYNPACEAGISPLAEDIDWSLCEPNLKDLFQRIAPGTALISPKDKAGLSVSAWASDERSQNFVYPDGTPEQGGSRNGSRHEESVGGGRCGIRR
jgi:dTDP-4-dehydrorhamnose 3,5-epimerase